MAHPHRIFPGKANPFPGHQEYESADEREEREDAEGASKYTNVRPQTIFPPDHPVHQGGPRQPNPPPDTAKYPDKGS